MSVDMITRKPRNLFSTLLDYSFKEIKRVIIHLNEWHDRKTTEKGREKCGEWKRREGQTERVRQMRSQQVRGQRRTSLCVHVCVYWGGVWSETFGLWTSLIKTIWTVCESVSLTVSNVNNIFFCLTYSNSIIIFSYCTTQKPTVRRTNFKGHNRIMDDDDDGF